ncbi:MAG: hypothetical protein HYX87_03310, partial [Chloroflexi bacterium]|nr:hypothetical protein [Chloroflexota bacterium]
MIPRMGILSWPPSPWPGKLLLLASVALLLLGACLPAATPSPSPSSELPPSSGNLPISEGGAQKGPVPTDGRAEVGDGVTVSPGQAGGSAGSYSVVERTYQWVGIIVVRLLEGRHLELKRDCDEWVLLPPSEDVSRRLEDNAGNQVVIWGQVFTGPTIYMRQAIAVQSAFGPGDPMPMTLVAVPEYPCPGTPTPKPVPPLQPITLLPGEIATLGYPFWEEGQPYLETPSGRILLLIPADVGLPFLKPPATSDPGSPPGLVRPQVIAVGQWSLKGGQLIIAVRYLRAWLAPVTVEPSPVEPAPPHRGQGTIYGRVRIGPLCPVEPCPSPGPADLYSS